MHTAGSGYDRSVTRSHHDFGARLFQALASPVRLRMLELLGASGSMTVSELQQRLEIAPANASQHLAVLRDRGLVNRRREASGVWYSIADPALRSLLEDARALFEHQVVEDARLLEAIEPAPRTGGPSPNGS